MQKIVNGIAAGLMIVIGGAVFLSCDIKYVGAVLFAVALLCICFKGYSLFTGKVGYMAEKHGKEEWSVLLLGLLGNTIAVALGGFIIRYTLPAAGDTAEALASAKLLQAPLQTFIRAIFCGILMYMAVSIYRDQKTIAGIIFCIPVFILSGFEHSIADMFYFAAGGVVSIQAFLYIWIVIFGNAAGSLLFPAMEKVIHKN